MEFDSLPIDFSASHSSPVEIRTLGDFKGLDAWAAFLRKQYFQDPSHDANITTFFSHTIEHREVSQLKEPACRVNHILGTVEIQIPRLPKESKESKQRRKKEATVLFGPLIAEMQQTMFLGFFGLMKREAVEEMKKKYLKTPRISLSKRKR